jgi:hypothetical protein
MRQQFNDAARPPQFLMNNGSVSLNPAFSNFIQSMMLSIDGCGSDGKIPSKYSNAWAIACAPAGVHF